MCTELSPAFSRLFLLYAALGLIPGFVFECWKVFAVKEEEGSERGLFLEVEALQRFKEVQNFYGFQILLQDLFVFHPLVFMAQQCTLHQFSKDD